MIGNIITVHLCFVGGFIVVNGLTVYGCKSYHEVVNDDCQIISKFSCLMLKVLLSSEP